MSDAALMQRMERGRPGENAPGEARDNGWFISTGPRYEHFRVWPLVASVLFPCLGVVLVGFDSGATAWLTVAIKLCSHHYSNWCDIIYDNVWFTATLESCSQMAAFVACSGIYLFDGSRLGGRTELLLASMLFTIGSTIEGESAEIKENVAGMYVLFIGRILYGFGIAFTMHAVPSYISEFSPPSLRGTLGGMIEVAATVGIIYAYAIGQWLTYEFPYGFSWKYTFKFATIFGILMFFGMLYLPDSPRWLVSSGRPLYEALEAAQFVNPSITSDDIVALKKDIERQVPTTTESVTSRLFCSPSLRVPMLVGVGIISAQQLTGLPGMLYYLVDIMKEVAGDQYKIALIVFAATKLLSSIVVMLYLDTWGRRTPLIAGLVIMFFSAGTLFMLFYDSLQKDSGYEVGFIALLCTFVTGYEFSVGSVSFVLMGEIFPGDVKGDAIAVAFIFNFFLAAGMAFMLYWEINDLSFTIVWAQLSLTSFVFIFFAASLVPETKGKTLEEIQKEFQQDFEVPDFLAAVDYLSGGEEGSGAESAARAVGDMQAAAAAGAAYIFQSGDNVAGDGESEQNSLLQNQNTNTL